MSKQLEFGARSITRVRINRRANLKNYPIGAVLGYKHWTGIVRYCTHCQDRFIQWLVGVETHDRVAMTMCADCYVSLADRTSNPKMRS